MYRVLYIIYHKSFYSTFKSLVIRHALYILYSIYRISHYHILFAEETNTDSLGFRVKYSFVGNIKQWLYTTTCILIGVMNIYRTHVNTYLPSKSDYNESDLEMIEEESNDLELIEEEPEARS